MRAAFRSSARRFAAQSNGFAAPGATPFVLRCSVAPCEFRDLRHLRGRGVSLHLRGNRHLEAARLRDLEGAGLPLSVVRLGVELHARRLRARRDLIDVLLRTDEEAHPDPFLAVASLLPVVLAQADAGIARAQHDAKQLAVFFPLVFHHESQAFEESDALLKVVDREAW